VDNIVILMIWVIFCIVIVVVVIIGMMIPHDSADYPIRCCQNLHLVTCAFVSSAALKIQVCVLIQVINNEKN